MAVTTTYTSAGNREDLINVVTRISPEETPLLSAIGKTKATGVRHEWMTDTLAPPSFNAQIEGSDAVFGTLTPRVRVGNSCQILRKEGQISDTQQAVMKAGVANEYAYQLEKATKELAIDAERAHWQGADSTGATAAPRTSRGVLSFVSTNRVSLTNGTGADLSGTAQAGAASTITVAAGTGGGVTAGDQILLSSGVGAGQYRIVASVATDVVTVTEAWDVIPDNTSAYIVYTAPVALTEAAIGDGLQAAYDAGGRPNALYVSGAQKRAISGFGTAQRVMNDGNKALTATIDVYDSDFGRMAVKYDRWAPEGTVGILEEAKFKTAWLRPIKAEELPRTGSSRKFMLEGEMCLESLAENASAMVYGAA